MEMPNTTCLPHWHFICMTEIATKPTKPITPKVGSMKVRYSVGIRKRNKLLGIDVGNANIE